MNFLYEEAIKAITGKCYKPLNESKDDKRVSPLEHLVRILGPALDARAGKRALVRAELIYRNSNGEWERAERFYGMDELAFYDLVQETDLPWNSTERMGAEPVSA